MLKDREPYRGWAAPQPGRRAARRRTLETLETGRGKSSQEESCLPPPMEVSRPLPSAGPGSQPGRSWSRGEDVGANGLRGPRVGEASESVSRMPARRPGARRQILPGPCSVSSWLCHTY